ncbi:hypothetical protein D3C86_1247760 [compost metagenome]
MNRLQRAMAGLDRFAQSGDRGSRSAGIAHIRRQTLKQSTEGLLCIAVQGNRARIKVVEFARVDVDAQQFGVERQAFTPVVGIGHFGADRQHHVGLGDQVPARFYAQG